MTQEEARKLIENLTEAEKRLLYDLLEKLKKK